ncbi:MAG: CocE/NonD family hydrolase [Flavobacteriales bacterium]
MKKNVLVLFLVAITICHQAQLTWEEVAIPMSDDSTLAADVYLPEGWTSGPVILIQTPYNKNLLHLVGLPLNVGLNLDESDYAFVVLDWRGFWSSTGAAYEGAPTRGEDGYDAVQWIAEQTWCDGNVGTWGPSALGKVQFQTAQQHPPNLKCIVPLVAGPQFDYDEYYTGGALRTEFVEQLDNLGFGLSPIIIGNPYYSLLWSVSENLNFYPEEIEVPTLMIGGWYDHNVEVMLDFFGGLQTQSPADVQDEHRLLIGPWVHGGNSTANVGSAEQGELSYPAAEDWNDSLAIAFLDYYLRGIDNNWDETPAIQYFQMGEDVWKEGDAWPGEITTTVKFLMRADGLLSTGEYVNGPVENALTLSYDPGDPSPTIGGTTLRNDLDQGPYDQTDEVESRDDVLLFTTEVLAADAVLAGKAKVHLQFSTDVTDTDFAIRLCDVYPDGRSMLLNDGIYRSRFINGFATGDEQLLTPGNTYACEIELPNTALTFVAGHRIRVIISGSNYPRFNRNMNTGGEMYPNLDGDELVNEQTAQSEIFVGNSSTAPSYLELPLVGGFDAIANDQQKTALIVFPNPADEYLTATLPVNMTQGEWLLTDAWGRVLMKEPYNGTLLINTASLLPSTYLLKVIGDTKTEEFVFCVFH